LSKEACTHSCLLSSSERKKDEKAVIIIETFLGSIRKYLLEQSNHMLHFPADNNDTEQKQIQPPSNKNDIVVAKLEVNTHDLCEISSSHGGEYDVQSCFLRYTAV
jgi:hypothetical protein